MVEPRQIISITLLPEEKTPESLATINQKLRMISDIRSEMKISTLFKITLDLCNDDLLLFHCGKKAQFEIRKVYRQSIHFAHADDSLIMTKQKSRKLENVHQKF